MVLSARSEAGSNPRFFPLQRPSFSNFRFIDKHAPGLPSLGRILSQVRQLGGKTLVVEDIGSAGELREESEDLKRVYPGWRESKTIRLSFFNASFASKRALHTLPPSSFLGYAILRTDVIRKVDIIQRIYESVVRPAAAPKKYVHGAPRWLCRVAGCSFPLQGFMYAQQNRITTCCVHVAIRTILPAYAPSMDLSYRKINHLIDDFRRETTTKHGDGIFTNEIELILGAHGLNCHSADYTRQLSANNAPRIPYFRYVYGNIESGFPSLLLFDVPTKKKELHAIPVFGHTMNTDTWVPAAEHHYFTVGEKSAYVPSETWLSEFLVHDDNCGSNFCIPKNFLNNGMICNSRGKEVRCTQASRYVAHVFTPLPKRLRLTPMRAELIGFDFVKELLPHLKDRYVSNPWGQRLLDYQSRNSLVLRTTLTDLAGYARHLSKVSGWGDEPINPVLLRSLRKSTNEDVWLVEVSVPELFSANQRKLGEIVVRDISASKDGRRNVHHFIIARVPSFFIENVSDGNDQISPQFYSSGIDDHVALFRCESN